MTEFKATRRNLLKIAGSIGGATLLAGQFPGIAAAAAQAREAQQFSTLSAQQANDLEAICARILPTTDSPGAREAGAIWFIDRAAGHELAEELPLLLQGLAALESEAGKRFAELADAEQDTLLQRHQDSDFFNTMKLLTVAGTFAMAEYGGNRDHLGWALLNFSHRHAWTPPFGFYDAQASEGQQ